MSTTNIVVSTPTFTTDDLVQKAGVCVDLYCDIAKTLKLDNKAVLQQAWRYKRGNIGNEIRPMTHPYNTADTSNIGVFLRSNSVGSYLKMANDFVGFNYGLFVTQTANTGNSNTGRTNKVVGIIPCAIEGQTVDSDEKFTASSVMFPTTDWCARHIIKCADGDDGTRNAVLNKFKVFSYSGTNLTFIAAYGMTRSVIFSYAKNIADSNDIKPICIMTPIHLIASSSNDNWDKYDANTGLVIDPTKAFLDIYFNNNRFISATYTSNINKYSTVVDKCILYKFTHKGYYCDNIFTYEGELPYEHFIYNNEEYVRIVYNLVIKLT